VLTRPDNFGIILSAPQKAKGFARNDAENFFQKDEKSA
jgi:hypothetical protein